MSPLAALALAAAVATTPAQPTFLIVNPSGRGNQAMAEGFLKDFSAALREGGATGEWTGRYHVTEADALASIRRSAPDLALVSPGFYFVHAEKLGLVPLLQPVRRHEGPAVAHLVVREGAPAKVLAAMRIGGPMAGEPAWAAGPVLRVAPGAAPSFVPADRTLEAIRQLRDGTVDAVLLHDADWALLQKTGKAAGLKVAMTSGPLPEGPLVSFGEPSPRAKEAVAAILRFPEGPAGRKVLERMTLREFRRPTEESLPPKR